MELNKLVFPVPSPSYTHESMNSGEISYYDSATNTVQLPVEKPSKKRGCYYGSTRVKAQMLYVPKFKLYSHDDEVGGDPPNDEIDEHGTLKSPFSPLKKGSLLQMNWKAAARRQAL
jgi:hypothetical protein